jgi:hypothetical protein
VNGRSGGSECEVDVYPAELHPLVVGIENTDTIKERGNGSTGDRSDMGGWRQRRQRANLCN